MQLYIGIDDHASTCTYAVLDEQGQLKLEGTVETRLENLRGVLESLRGTRHVAVGNGTRAAWLYQGLRQDCEEILVAKTNGLKKYQENKNDQIDSRELAELYRMGKLKPIYIHTQEQLQTLKQMVRSYEQIVQDTTRCKNRIKAIFLSVGQPCAGSQLYHPEHREKYLEKIQPIGHRQRLQRLLKQLDGIQLLRKEARQEMIRQARKQKKEYAIIRSVEGIGPVRAAQLLAHIGNIARIRNKRALWKMSGLAVISASSGDYHLVNPQTGEMKLQRRASTRGLNWDYNRTLKSVFKGAALCAIHYPGVFQQHYQQRLEQGMAPELARLTITRKLIASTLACWQKGEMFDPNRVKQPLLAS